MAEATSSCDEGNGLKRGAKEEGGCESYQYYGQQHSGMPVLWRESSAVEMQGVQIIKASQKVGICEKSGNLHELFQEGA